MTWTSQSSPSSVGPKTAPLCLPAVDRTKRIHLQTSTARGVSPKTILLVDDDEDVRYITKLVLNRSGYGVISCSGADFALNELQSAPLISLLLTDMQMPERSGIELARDVTALRPSLPVLIVSGRIPSLEVQGEINDRSWTFLSKAAEQSVFLRVIAALLK